MATVTTTTQPPSFRERIVDEEGQIKKSVASWLFVKQNEAQLKIVDTTSGNYAETTPPAGLNSSTGQSNQNQRLTYKKKSADGNTFTLTGTTQGPLPEGPLTLTAQYSKFTIQSDGTTWYVVG